ncbi:MAG: GDSL-type esterase/lipase family protein [Pirellulales bacterium]
MQTSTGPVQPAAQPSPQAKWWRRKRYILLAFVLLLVAGEIAVRVLAGTNSKFNVFIGAAKEFDPEIGVRLKKNYHNDATHVHINSRGFFGAEFEEKKAPGGFRVVTLGDSASFIPARRNYPTVLQDRLRSAYPQRPMEVINASVPGYSAFQGHRWYEREVDGYEHDALVIYLGWNDMGQYNPDGLPFKLDEAGYLPQPSLVHRALSHCYLLRSIYVPLGYWERSRPVSHEPLSEEDQERYEQFYPDHYEKHLRETIELAKRRGRRVLLLNFASLISDAPTESELARMHFPRGMGKSLPKYRLLIAAYSTALGKVARETQTPIVDIASLFDTPERREVFRDTAHYRVAGAERIADRVFQALKPIVEAMAGK